MQAFKLRPNDPYIELYKVLKYTGLADAGASAKYVIAQGLVQVNQQLETRKRRKLVEGDLVEFEGVTIEILRGQE